MSRSTRPARTHAPSARLFVERRMADGQPPEEERLCEQVSRAAGVPASPTAAGPAAADASSTAAVQTSQPAPDHSPPCLRVWRCTSPCRSSDSSDEDRPLCQRRPAAKIRSELPDSSEEDQPLCRRARRPAAEASESSDEDKPLSQLKKRRRRSSPIESEEDTPLAQRAVAARVETARLVALGVPAERVAGVARFISSLPPHTRTGFELAYAYAAAL